MKNHIKYPVGKPFSLKMLLAQQNLIKNENKKITKVGLYLKVKRDINKGVLAPVGQRKSGTRGRPAALFQLVSAPVKVTENQDQELVAA